ncbi:hypothetical protein SNE25_26855 [Mucilaginibacter sabulilitoris]|uniref:MotA/TolQ/ExbB proton channel domain-containing protein n=1 Tax=Mucilaginibacter sabulilitoris TaxID=1173583 RepID=A0ABZ0TL81_9SPHI|nr:hypothetical protein [Mucilaginibacter sabulilitoris]WPU92948.1 hypothetical protein SNE25_26855 [Mucilaginibacter sabulilitoris]
MNIDELKDAWNNDDQHKNDQHLPATNITSGKTSSATGKLRRNMRNEFIATLISYAVILGALFGWHHPGYLFNMTYILLLILIVLNVYYFFKFYLFYKSMNGYDLNLKNSVRKVAYELELNIEIYKAYNFCIAPIAVLVAIGLLCGNQTAASIQQHLAGGIISTKLLLIMFANILISFIVVYACISWHVRSQYGKYLAELKMIMNDLENDD